MAYIGQGIKNGTFSVLDTSGNTYNGSNVTFNLGTQVGSPAQLLVSHDGVIQKPVTDYTIATGGTQITFTTAPASGASIFITEISGAVGAPMNRDINGDELILDADGDTSITADTDDQIDIKVAGADDLRITANAINVLSGTTLTIDSGATITNSGTANGFGSNVPSSADGQALGSASAEWSDLYLADGGIVYFGNDQDVTLTHVADEGLTLKTAATASDTYPTLNIYTGSTDVDDNDYLGRIEFKAPDEGTGTDAVTSVAAIYARAEADFSSSVNKTKLVFQTANSGSATDSLSLTGDGRGVSQYTAKMWCAANGTGTVAIIDSHNVSSLSDHETGQLGMNYTVSMGNANYAPIVNAWQGYAATLGAMDIGTDTFKATQSNGSAYTDFNRVNAIVFGDG
jgi:hypothetical protein